MTFLHSAPDSTGCMMPCEMDRKSRAFLCAWERDRDVSRIRRFANLLLSDDREMHLPRHIGSTSRKVHVHGLNYKRSKPAPYEWLNVSLTHRLGQS